MWPPNNCHLSMIYNPTFFCCSHIILAIFPVKIIKCKQTNFRLQRANETSKEMRDWVHIFSIIEFSKMPHGILDEPTNDLDSS